VDKDAGPIGALLPAGTAEAHPTTIPPA
jgi:hypothetical protein